MKGERLIADVATGECHALVLAQVVYPRFDHETLDPAAGVFDVAEQLPHEGAAAAAYPPYLLHDARDFAQARGVDTIFHGDHHGSAIEAEPDGQRRRPVHG